MTEEQQELNQFLARHGARVRRAKAMELLCIPDQRVFDKVVAANPQLKHRLDGEQKNKYVTAVIFDLMPKRARCAEGLNKSLKLKV